MFGTGSRHCQVVINLLSNAFKFTTKGSIRVFIDRYVNSNKIIVRIKDTGTGIHPDIMPKLFTKFATKSDTGGTGLGLFISKRQTIISTEKRELLLHLVCQLTLRRYSSQLIFGHQNNLVYVVVHS